ncbi:hypothetical protein [Pseudovibrio flavus]|nr:hypothetical protein [Pseudovibrio flavus]
MTHLTDIAGKMKGATIGALTLSAARMLTTKSTITTTTKTTV